MLARVECSAKPLAIRLRPSLFAGIECFSPNNPDNPCFPTFNFQIILAYSMLNAPWDPAQHMPTVSLCQHRVRRQTPAQSMPNVRFAGTQCAMKLQPNPSRLCLFTSKKRFLIPLPIHPNCKCLPTTKSFLKQMRPRCVSHDRA